MPDVTVDGREIEVRHGATMLQMRELGDAPARPSLGFVENFRPGPERWTEECAATYAEAAE